MLTTLEADTTDKAYPRSFDLDIHSPDTYSDAHSPPLPPVPSTEYNRKMWWDNLLNTYAPTREQACVSQLLFFHCRRLESLPPQYERYYHRPERPVSRMTPRACVFVMPHPDRRLAASVRATIGSLSSMALPSFVTFGISRRDRAFNRPWCLAGSRWPRS